MGIAIFPVSGEHSCRKRPFYRSGRKRATKMTIKVVSFEYSTKGTRKLVKIDQRIPLPRCIMRL